MKRTNRNTTLSVIYILFRGHKYRRTVARMYSHLCLEIKKLGHQINSLRSIPSSLKCSNKFSLFLLHKRFGLNRNMYNFVLYCVALRLQLFFGGLRRKYSILYFLLQVYSLFIANFIQCSSSSDDSSILRMDYIFYKETVMRKSVMHIPFKFWSTFILQNPHPLLGAHSFNRVL